MKWSVSWFPVGAFSYEEEKKPVAFSRHGGYVLELTKEMEGSFFEEGCVRVVCFLKEGVAFPLDMKNNFVLGG